jgi:hypothetical protein
MDSNIENERIKQVEKVKVEEKKESTDLKKLITKVDNRVKTKVSKI